MGIMEVFFSVLGLGCALVVYVFCAASRHFVSTPESEFEAELTGIQPE